MTRAIGALLVISALTLPSRAVSEPAVGPRPALAAIRLQSDQSSSALQLYIRAESWYRYLTPLDGRTLAGNTNAPTIHIGPTSIPAPDVLVASEDGTTLATESYTGLPSQGAPIKPRNIVIRIFDLRTGARRAQFHPPVSLSVGGLSPDGAQLFGSRMLANGRQRAEWYALSTADGRVMSRMRFPSGCCGTTLFDPASRRFYVLDTPNLHGRTDKPGTPHLAAYSLTSGGEVGRLALNGILAGSGVIPVSGNNPPVYEDWAPGFALSPDGSRIAVLDGSDDNLLVIDAAHLRIVRTEHLSRPGVSMTPLQRLASALGLLPETALAKEWLGVSVDMRFSPDGQRLYVTGRTAAVGQGGKYVPGGLGLRTVDVAGGRILAEALPDQWIEQTLVAPDGSGVYTVTPANSAGAGPLTLRRHDPLTLQVTARRQLDDVAGMYFLVPPILGAPGCRPASPSEPWGGPPGPPEVRGTIRHGQLWALLFGRFPIQARQEVKIVWRMTGKGPFHIFAQQTNGFRIKPIWGPLLHGGSNWNRPGGEWGTGFNFPRAGCWRVHASRTGTAGDVWLKVAPRAIVRAHIRTTPSTGGRLWIWGNNRLRRINRPVAVSGLRGIVATAASDSSLAVRSDGTVWAWGPNGAGQLGNGSTRSSKVPVRVRGLTQVRAVAAGGEHSLALRRDGSVWAWGNNTTGQLGNGTTRNAFAPVRVRGLTKVIAIAAPNSGWMAPLRQQKPLTGLWPLASMRKQTPGGYSMALRSDGTVWVWGDNYFNFTNGAPTNYETPTRVRGLGHVVAIAAGGAHVLALQSNGVVRAWGSDTFDQLGAGMSGDQGLVRVQGLHNVVAISAGDQHSLALERDGTVWTWGREVYHRWPSGQVERCGSHEPCSSVAVRVRGLSRIVAVAAGAYHDLALRSDGTLWAWGDNSVGQLGITAGPEVASPHRVSGLPQAIAVAAGSNHNLAITAK